MIDMLRSLFGMRGESGSRMVVGQPVQVDVKAAQYIRDSNTRLTMLLNLQNRYKGTPQEPKFRAIHEKTKRIHNYLVSKKRLHELELFHLQHTDHFISTYSIIIDVHQRHETGAPLAHEQQPPEPIAKRPQPETVKQKQAGPVKYVADLAKKAREKSAGAVAASEELPLVVLPLISLDKYASIVYARESSATGPVTKTIGYHVSEQEKADFLQHVASRLGIGKEGLSYAGNAMLSVPARDGISSSGNFPVIGWVGFYYALNLTDYRLFPVTLARESGGGV
ncbi:hypothetical protein FVR03_01645 [Pontibacter qinzhouensis]|uniref:Uncharacterized protein n=1 Tax=Pontibacter qinzhouensis TaxID=2603253 RepID=A0A5C8KB23_9BACT|nr:hypothetical protein [Pontibacter qinzhouensis]TXK52151.1 hypothetical protein FVR03_01645 [Pontibacter qinzhouensis]